ncbi:hypothetical protein [Nostoc sp. GT001]|nr:hypothetical protein [Nostoc sp. GT001]MDM9585988.1 hypothetical protein [Nostoc sp. GT001]
MVTIASKVLRLPSYAIAPLAIAEFKRIMISGIGIETVCKG